MEPRQWQYTVFRSESRVWFTHPSTYGSSMVISFCHAPCLKTCNKKRYEMRDETWKKWFTNYEWHVKCFISLPPSPPTFKCNHLWFNCVWSKPALHAHTHAHSRSRYCNQMYIILIDIEVYDYVIQTNKHAYTRYACNQPLKHKRKPIRNPPSIAFEHERNESNKICWCTNCTN